MAPTQYSLVFCNFFFFFFNEILCQRLFERQFIRISMCAHLLLGDISQQ